MSETGQPIVAKGDNTLALPSNSSSLVGMAAQSEAISELQTLRFEVVELDYKGAILRQETKRNHYFRENLGESVHLDLMYVSGEVLNNDVLDKDVFKMGSPEDEEGRFSWDGPQHSVKISSFFMGRYPVTQAQWGFIAALPKVNMDLTQNLAHFKGNHRPVERVNWYEAVEFCSRLSIYTGKHYRLPSEAEWEYGCRAGTTTPFSFGETLSPEVATYNASKVYSDEPVGDVAEGTTLVGTSGFANNFGLYDMHGNVWEWCQDVWHDNYQNAPTDGTAWVNGGNQSMRVLRGGSWVSSPRFCRSACRSNHELDDFYTDYGFRVVFSGSELSSAQDFHNI